MTDLGSLDHTPVHSLHRSSGLVVSRHQHESPSPPGAVQLREQSRMLNHAVRHEEGFELMPVYKPHLTV